MRKTWLLAFGAVLALGFCGRAYAASEGFDDIAKLAKSGIGEEVLIAYVQASPIAYDLDADEIIYLNDLGMTKETLQAIINHGRDLRAGKEPVVVEEDFKPLDTTPPLITDPNFAQDDQDPTLQVNPAVVQGDPNAPLEAPTYVSPLTGVSSSTPELYQEREVVRETVAIAAPVEACTECTVSHFYEALTPYGTWINVNGTWCWQPSVCAGDPSWRPYGNRGRWIWSDAGWCWESEYSWGWAPFHYGRWYRADGYGWLWAPDTVWGPAWVNWRQSDSHWGWAPLPPAARFETEAAVGVGFHFGGKNWGVNVGVGFEFGLGHRDYCFVPRERFCDSGLHTHFVAHTHHAAIYQQTTIIQNNITIVNNNVFVNGPRHDVVAQVTRRELRQYRIHDNDIRPGQPLRRAQYADKDTYVLAVYRPRVSRGAAESPSEIAARQLAKSQINARPVADARGLAAQARADELRERHFAAQDARRDEVLLRQSDRIEAAAEKRADIEQLKINRAMANTDRAEDKAALAAKLAEERKAAEQARLQRIEIQKQAADQRQLAQQLARERNRVAHSAVTTESVKSGADTRVRLAAERAERERAQKEASIQADAIRKTQQQRIAEARANAKNDTEGKQLAAEAERKAKLDAERAAREANQKAHADLVAKQKAQLEADRVARQNAARIKQPAANTDVSPRTRQNDPNAGAAAVQENDRKAKMEADRIARQKAAQDAAAARDAAGDDRKEKMEADRIAKQKAAQLEAQQNAAERAAKLKAQQDAAAAREAQQDQLEAQRKAKLEADRIARQKATQDEAQQGAAERAAKQKAAQDAAAARQKAAQDAAAAREAQQDQLEAQRKAKLEADRTAKQKAAQDAAAAREAQRDARTNRNNPTPPAPGQAVNPQTGKTYNPNDPNDPNSPANTRKGK